MDAKKNSQLTEALHHKVLMRFWRRYEDSWTHGYVLDMARISSFLRQSAKT
jgi:hypothetical protein